MPARFAFLLTVFFCLVAGLQPALAKERVSIHDIRLWRAPDSTRLVFDMDNAAEHTMQVLQNPDRVVLNVANAVMLSNPARISFQGTPVAGLRSSVQANGELRIELALSAKVTAKSFFLKKNPPMDDRLVLDLMDTAPADAPMEEADDIESILNGSSPSKPTPVATSLPATAVVKTAPAATPAASPEKPAELPKMVAVPADTRRRQLIIAIDAGHGGEDPGAMGPAGIREKDVVLQISKKVLDNFNRQPGYRAMLTRKSDYYVGLVQRRDIARKANADLFVAIHADAFTRPQANGSSVYALSSRGATSASAQFLADKENQSDLVGGVSLDDKDAVLSSVLVDLSMTYKMEASLDVGASVLRKIANISRLHSNKVEQAAFAVLKTPDIPSILVETGFISNQAEAKKLSSGAYQQKMADAIYTGINEYFIRKAPEGTYFSRQQASVSTPAPAAVKPSSAWSSPEIMHKVSRGETLSGIAHQYGMSMKTLVDYNHLSSSEVRIGQQLKIPPRR